MRATGWLLTFGLLVMVGSLLPWVDTIAQTYSGYQGAGLATLAGGAIIMAGLLLHSMFHRRWLLVGHAIVGGSIAAVLATWQVLRLVRVCASGGCVPGPGLVLVLIGGIGALLVARRILVEAGEGAATS